MLIPTANLPADFSVDTYTIKNGKLVKASAEVINDINGELINFYCVAKSYAPLLIAEIGNTLHACDHYNRANNIYNNP